MKKKIDQIIQDLLLSQKTDLNQKYILISKGYSIIEYIKNKYKSKFSPETEFFTIEKFFEKISGLQILDNHSILLYFFSLLKDDFLEKNFNSFFNWGPKILNDFQNIDINMIDVEGFFSSIISTEKIKKWNLNILEQEKFLFWEKIHEYYYILQSQLLKKGITYQGMLFKIALSRFDFFLSENSSTKILLFIDFILNKCEKIFVQKIIQYSHGSVYHLYEKKIKKNIFESKIHNQNTTSKTHKKFNNLKVIEVSKEIEQVKTVENIVYKLIKKGKKPCNILIIPGDNCLLIPLLHSIKKLGINMSINIDYYFKNIPIYYTFYSIFQLLLRKDKFKKFTKKDVIRVLSDGYIQKFFIKKNSLLKKLKNENDSDLISEDFIKKYLLKNDLWIIFQISTHNTKIILLSLISFIRKLKKLLFANRNKHFIELRFLFKLEVYINKLRTIVRKKKNLLIGINDIFKIYEQFVNTKSIRYIRKNKRGLYITGFMDLFFKNFDVVIITSFNEGIIPPKNHEKNYSFIPFDLRQRLKMKDFNNDIYFHHFIRIFQSSTETYLIYKNQPDEINSGEKSRFIHQMEMNYKISTEKINNPFISINLLKVPIVIEKTKSIIHRLHELIAQGLSPSSIHLYNYNPLLFYYKKILRLDDPEETSFKKKVGQVIHQILKILYSPIIENFITINRIHDMKKISESIVKKVLLGKQKTIEGKNMLFYCIIKTYIENFISWDEKCIQNGHKIFVKEIECKVSTILNVGSKKVNLHGIIDRIDEYDGIPRILDYKIGFSKIKEMNVSLKNIKNIFQDPNYANTMQLLIYVYLWFKSPIFFEKKSPTIVEILSPEKNGEILPIPINFFHQKKRNITYEDYRKNFLPFLIKRISEILDPKIPIIEKIY
ncbi:PD-(D/E)XK nuclease family protein [Blattabacterium cuenoti]|uniref:PD-(D/E)XK nuclease family protein n=1 Tax=Blattabacterium cuenoti TaxID=1653831 RepID=UPI00163C28FE|nr:PD-(D/E)XK nuclease family protein [Blattabacterium cuenoti]